MVTKGSEATKTALQIAELQQRERSLMPTAQARKTTFKTVYDNVTGTNREAVVDELTGEILGFVGEGLIAKPPAEQMPSPQIPPPTGGSKLGLPPMMAPTVEGPEIPIDESQKVGTLPNGDELMVYQGKQYTVPAPSVLPPIQQPSTAQPSAISQAAALPIEATPAQPSAIRSAAAMTPSVAQQPRFQAPREDPAKAQERELRQRVAESTIAANLATVEKTKSETEAKIAKEADAQEKAVMAAAKAKAEIQNARSSVRQSVSEVNKFADKIGSNIGSDILKQGTQFFSSSDQAKLKEAVKPISSAMIWDQMSKLRAASATGSTGLGSLTEGERKNLESTVASLDAMQDPIQLKLAMRKIEDYMNNAEYGNWYEREALVKSGKMSPVRFNEVEMKYLNPQPMSLEGASRFTPDEQLTRDKYKKP